MTKTLEQRADALSAKIVSLVKAKVSGGSLAAYDGVESAREIKALMIEAFTPTHQAVTVDDPAVSTWRLIADDPLPLDETVIVCVEATEENTTYSKTGFRQSYPAYIDEDGNVCDPSTWKPDGSLDGEKFRTIAWQYLPEPLTAAFPQRREE